MATAVLARAGRLADEVREEARQLDPAKVVLTLLMIMPFVVGWTIRKLVKAAWVIVSWIWTAGVVGWRAAGGEGSGGG